MTSISNPDNWNAVVCEVMKLVYELWRCLWMYPHYTSLLCTRQPLELYHKKQMTSSEMLNTTR